MDLIALIAEHADAGVISRARLITLGADAREISKLRHARVLVVIRRGWYATAVADSAVVAAVRNGGTLTCVSAVKFTPGVWVPPGITRTHIRWPEHLAPPARAKAGRAKAGRAKAGREARQRASHGTAASPGTTDRRHRCHSHRGVRTPTRAIDPLAVALQHAAHCLSDDYLVAVLDSTLRMPNPYSEEDLREIFEGAPQRVRRLLDRLDPLAGSGSESVTRIRLQNAHVTVRSQVEIEDLGRVDLLVGERLIVECDSKEHHNNEQRTEDNRRDRIAVLAGYRVLRFDYDDLLFRWDTVFAEIMTIVRARRHRAPRRRPLTISASSASEALLPPPDHQDPKS
ncbi:endonuclease domain-containing protein [Tsukamurella spumae]|uniref:DUF559 domain-containing protein n=1 Tax=Tsukamurella spumae TaxID=44753 RepID=A0A846X203_9ACTN|nr:DUF559 domain-containing protein [Tsukamurella spumae]NKY19637.1 DUF559 domain-containing protein [Tsukamurella spumae]